MTARRLTHPALGAALMLAAAPLLAAGGSWQADDGTVHHPAHGKAIFVGEDDLTEDFDLSELRDGETRTFGETGETVTAERRGEVVTIARTGDGPLKTRTITCRVGVDTCRVLTFDGDPEKVSILVEKTRRCVDGVGDCEANDFVHAAGDGAHVVIERIDCAADEADCEGSADVIVKRMSGPAPARLVLIEDGVPGEAHNVFLRRLGPEGPAHTTSGGAMLRCPEGDTTMLVEAAEADRGYLCPKHSVPLERQSATKTIHIMGGERPHEH